MEIVVLGSAKKELLSIPKDLRIDVYSLFDELMAGKILSMPISRPLSSIHKGLHELRLSGHAGEFRVFYYIKIKEAIYIIHVGQKKTQTMNKKTHLTIKARIKSII